eukprot:TRINITY_DN10404_c0_g1_i1.p1 TRINITY_DN10404_c0_g1~~TRINITY_DN10404_c0_g1_i1.p1  ORF type:complete len:143 (-),score=48.15 TRINITY_DN10404_c0_g1_i1:8-394(-)
MSKFAERTFFWSGVYGLIVLLPLYGLESTINEQQPPAITHPEHFYLFTSVAVAWQIAFLIISQDVQKFRPMMLAAMAEKFLASGTAITLFVLNRITLDQLVPLLGDLILGVLFVIAYLKTSSDEKVKQ